MLNSIANVFAHRFCTKDVHNRRIMEINEVRRARMRELKRTECGGKQKLLADKLDTDAAYMSTLIGKNPTRDIGSDLAARAEEVFGKPLGWMSNMDQREYMLSQGHNNLDEIMELVAPYRSDILPDIQVPQFSLSASMGPGNEVSSEDIVDYVTINEKHLMKAGVTPSQAAIIEVEGDSMNDTYYDGELVIVDRTPVLRLAGKVYVLWSERMGLQAKRLTTSPDGSEIEIISDNSEYQNFTYSPEEFESTFKVRGTVITPYIPSSRRF